MEDKLNMDSFINLILRVPSKRDLGENDRGENWGENRDPVRTLNTRTMHMKMYS